ncbi:MAG: phosphatidate cytidylyltransferase [Fidelibacterota bacterium]
MLVNIVGIPALLWIIRSGGLIFTFFIALVSLLALWEFYQLASGNDFGQPQPVTGIVFALGIMAIFGFYPHLSGATLAMLAVTAFIALFLIELFLNRPHPTRNLAITILGVVYIPGLLGSFIGLRQWDTLHSAHLTMGVFVSVWVCDSFAYLFGKQWGKKKILPRVSPNKSWTGTLSGIVGAFLTLWAMKSFQFLGGDFGWKDIIILTFITGVFGQLGDFSESLIKRDAGVKDSGRLLKGHGGVLDRFDSLLFAGPLTYAYLVLTKLG